MVALRHLAEGLLFTVAWGSTPGSKYASRRLAEGHIQRRARAAVSMAFGQNRLNPTCSWGVTPGYGDNGLRPKGPRGSVSSF